MGIDFTLFVVWKYCEDITCSEITEPASHHVGEFEVAVVQGLILWCEKIR